jgi:hypothetical protein
MSATVLSLVHSVPRVHTPVMQNTETKQSIIRIVQEQKGVKETDLWMMAKAATGDSVTVISGMVEQMIKRGEIVAIEYRIGMYTNRLILPGGTRTVVPIAIHAVPEE